MVLQFRRTELADCSKIAQLISITAQDLFSTTNVVAAIEKALLAVTAVTESGQVVGHAAFYDYPNTQSINVASWEEWTAERYEESLQPNNSVFLRFFVAEPEHHAEATTGIMKTLFSSLPQIEHCLLPILNDGGRAMAQDAGLETLFTDLTPKPDALVAADPISFLSCRADSVCPTLKVRRAEASDYDDLMEIFNEQTEALEDRFGTFYLFKLIESQDEKSGAFVIELNERAVGFLHVKAEADISNFTKLFDLTTYDNLSHEDGTSSALTITLFAIKEEFDTRALDILPHVFDAFPKSNYCLLSLPPSASTFPLVEAFNNINALPGSSPDQELYVIHKYALSNDICIATLAADSVPQVEALVGSTPNGDAIMADVSRILSTGSDPDGTRVFGHVVMVMGAPAGVVICREGKGDALPIRANFNIEEYILYSQYQTIEFISLHHFVINPIFQFHTKFILTEVMRKLRRSVLLYKLYSSEAAKACSLPVPSVCSAIEYLVPVRPRPQVTYPTDVLGSNSPASRLLQTGPPFALYFTARKLILEPKININSRIVLVGDTDVTRSVIEELVFRPHLRFNNILVVSEDGDLRGYSPEPSTSSGSFLCSNYHYSEAQMQQLGLDTMVTVYKGHLADINTEERVAVLDTGNVLDYDHLVLCQDLVYINSLDRDQDHLAPLRVFSPSTQTDCKDVMEWLATSLDVRSKPVLVYGACVDAFTCVASLLDHNIAPSSIVLVLPPEPYTTFINDVKAEFASQEVTGIMVRALEAAGVQVRAGWTLMHYNADDEDGETLVSASFSTASTDSESTATPMTLPCHALFNFSRRDVSYETFKAIDAAYFVYDGRLVIDNAFHTSEDHVLAGGALTKYSRKYRADATHQGQVSPKDAGRMLAFELARELDPLETSKGVKEGDLPEFNDATMCLANLPFGYKYFHFHRPQIQDPTLLQGTQATAVDLCATTLSTTASANDADNTDPNSIKFFEIVLDEFGHVAALTCIAPAAFVEVDNFAQLYGLHEKLINHMVERYNEGLITDFFEYFHAAWSAALFHDRFKQFSTSVSQMVKDNPATDLSEVEKLLTRIGSLSLKRLDASGEEESVEIDKESEELLGDIQKQIGTPGVGQLVKDRLMDYLTFNAYHLSMYAKPKGW
eukprot:m.269616 g.269616  ORF g.269616 m.269616 type:complete len:1140 (+) comp15674_c0_seq14:154-3573(+)